MELVLLTHRLPWPPDKGERIRTFHLLRYLADRFAVTLVAPDDEGHAEVPADLRSRCREVITVPLGPWRRRWRLASALLGGRAASLHLFADPRLRRRLVGRLSPDLVLAVSTAACALRPHHWRAPLILDMVDVDSAKWAELAARARDPLHRALFAREARRVAAAERRWAEAARRVVFVAERERALFVRRHPDLAPRTRVVPNGVDLAAYRPDRSLPDPFAGLGGRRLVFVGRMDYPPNVEAVRFLVGAVLPRLLARGHDVRLHLVGAAPVRAVRRLAGPRVRVWGRVADVRPFQCHADVVVVPLAVARGVQNKLLEALAAGRPVVASPAAVAGLPADPAGAVTVAAEAEAFAAAVAGLLEDPDRARAAGAAARAFAERHLSWALAFRALDAVIAEVREQP